jgi:hypothetical protein
LIASSASFQIWATSIARLACLVDRRWNAFDLVSKYVISLTFFTAIFGNFAQVTDSANTNCISTTPALGKSRHFSTENVNIYTRPHLFSILLRTRHRQTESHILMFQEKLFLEFGEIIYTRPEIAGNKGDVSEHSLGSLRM